MRMRLTLQVGAIVAVAQLVVGGALARDADDAGFAPSSLVIIDANDEANGSVVSYVSEFETQSYQVSEFGYPLGQALLLQVPVPTAKPVVRASVSRVKKPVPLTRRDISPRVKRVSFSDSSSKAKLFLPLPIIVGLYR